MASQNMLGILMTSANELTLVTAWSSVTFLFSSSFLMFLSAPIRNFILHLFSFHWLLHCYCTLWLGFSNFVANVYYLTFFFSDIDIKVTLLLFNGGITLTMMSVALLSPLVEIIHVIWEAMSSLLLDPRGLPRVTIFLLGKGMFETHFSLQLMCHCLKLVLPRFPYHHPALRLLFMFHSFGGDFSICVFCLCDFLYRLWGSSFCLLRNNLLELFSFCRRIVWNYIYSLLGSTIHIVDKQYFVWFFNEQDVPCMYCAFSGVTLDIITH